MRSVKTFVANPSEIYNMVEPYLPLAATVLKTAPTIVKMLRNETPITSQNVADLGKTVADTISYGSQEVLTEATTSFATRLNNYIKNIKNKKDKRMLS